VITRKNQEKYMENLEELNRLSERIIGLAIEVHRHVGPGLLESAYRKCLCYEFAQNNIPYTEEQWVEIRYKELKIDCAYRADIIVDKRIVVEVKSVETIMPVHEAQLLTYLKFSNLKIGLLLNFNVPRLVDGIKRKIY